MSSNEVKTLYNSNEERKRFREVMCQPQKFDDILLWRKDVDLSSTALIVAVEDYWLARMEVLLAAAVKAERERILVEMDKEWIMQNAYSFGCPICGNDLCHCFSGTKTIERLRKALQAEPTSKEGRV